MTFFSLGQIRENFLIQVGEDYSLSSALTKTERCVGLQGLFKEDELKASGQDKELPVLNISPPVSLKCPPEYWVLINRLGYSSTNKLMKLLDSRNLASRIKLIQEMFWVRAKS